MGARVVALLKGEKFFSTGHLCIRGHITKRRTNTGRCTDCELENSRGVTKEYRAIYYQKNKEKLKQANKKSKAKHHEKRLQELTQWRKRNKDAIKRYNARWDKANRGRVNAKTARRRATLLNATPLWLSPLQQKQIRDFYVEACKTGLTVDHIVPLRGELVCGLHVPWNLQLLTRSENCSKGKGHDVEEHP